MLLHKVFAGNILKIQLILSITDCLSILFERVLLVACDEHLDVDLIAIRACFIVHLNPLKERTIPADHVMSTFTNCITIFMLQLFLQQKQFDFQSFFFQEPRMNSHRKRCWKINICRIFILNFKNLFWVWRVMCMNVDEQVGCWVLVGCL